MRGHPPQVITIGEAMILVTPALAEPLESAEIFHLDVGGAESNVASHLAALGHAAAWVSRVGDDALGRRVERLIRERGVYTAWVQVDPEASTGAYFKDPGNGVHYFRSGSAASRMGSDTLEAVPLEQADIIHLSGITPALSASCVELIDVAIDRASRSSAVVSFDVNYRSALWGVEDAAPRLLEIARRADIVFVGLDEAHTLWGTVTADDVRALLNEPGHLIVKDGDIGATEYSPTGPVFVPAIPTAVVEAVGAGDAFAAGYLAGWIDGLSSRERLLSGHQRAVLVLQSTTDFVVPDNSMIVIPTEGPMQ